MLTQLLEDSLKKVQTHSHRAKTFAGDLRNQGFSGTTTGAMIAEAQAALENAILYQGYINAKNRVE